jgi:hypothetical protein
MATASSQIEELLLLWQQEGLLEQQEEFTPVAIEQGDDWVILPPFLEAAQPMTLTVKIANLCCGLLVEDDLLAERLKVLLSRVWVTSPERLAHQLYLTGNESQWQLTINNHPDSTGQGLDSALTQVLHLLMNLVCQAEERLLVVHGAGFRLNDGQGVLLIAPGGSGKTTLATALNAKGYGLLSDDVVPVNLKGELLGLGTPICLKSGSWSLMMPYRSDIDSAQIIVRFGQLVRYLSPAGEINSAPTPLGLLLFPRYQLGSVPECQALCPEQALQLIIEAEAVIRHLTQTKLEVLISWVSSVPAYAMSYPDLDSGLKLIQQQINSLSKKEAAL